MSSISDLQKEFERIKKMGWIKEKRKGPSSIGYTFEVMLKKEEENFPIPDFGDIEIKTMNTKAKHNLHLFNLTPDGDYVFPIKRILDILGYPDKDNPKNKVLYRSFSGAIYNKMIYGRSGILKVNYEKEKVQLLVYDHRGNNINLGISWSFSWLKERLNLKLRYLAIIRVTSRIIYNEGYYYYNKINFYKLKDFNTLLSLIEKGIIEVTFKIGVYKSGRRTGEIYDHGTDFSIKPENILLLYNEIKV